MTEKRQFVLPESVVGPAEVRRMVRELEDVDAFLRSAQVREPGTALRLPRLTKALQDLTEANSLRLLHESDRARTSRVLTTLEKTAPVLHVSFATDPSAAFVRKILVYIRQNMYRYALVQIGLQPSIGAGCVVRTNNKVFDFSLRQHLLSNRKKLLESLAAMGDKHTGDNTLNPKPYALNAAESEVRQ